MSNKGLFTPQDINDLIGYNQWTRNVGSLELIETTSVDDVTALDFTDIKADEYRVHLLFHNYVEAHTNNTRAEIQFRERTGTTTAWQTGSVYKYGYQQVYQGGGSDLTGNSEDEIPFNFEIGNSADDYGCGFTYFYYLGDSSKYSYVTNHHSRTYSSYIAEYGIGVMNNASLVDGIRLKVSAASSGTLDFEQISLYGIRYS
jgi:hypothetical protein